MGKYTKVLKEGRVEKLREEPEYQEKIDAVKKSTSIGFHPIEGFLMRSGKAGRTFLATDKTILAERWSSLRNYKDDLEARIKEVNLAIAAMQQLVLARLDDEGIDRFGVAGSLYYLQDEPYFSIDDKAKVVAWFKANGLEDMLSVNYQTLSGFVKERILDKEVAAPVPDGVKMFVKETLRERR